MIEKLNTFVMIVATGKDSKAFIIFFYYLYNLIIYARTFVNLRYTICFFNVRLTIGSVSFLVLIR